MTNYNICKFNCKYINLRQKNKVFRQETLCHHY